MMVIVSATDLRLKTRSVLDAARSGETVVIEDYGRPVAAVVSLQRHEQAEAKARELAYLKAFKHFLDAGSSKDAAESLAGQFVAYQDQVQQLDCAPSREDFRQLADDIVARVPLAVIDYDIDLLFEHNPDGQLGGEDGDLAAKLKRRFRLVGKVRDQPAPACVSPAAFLDVLRAQAEEETAARSSSDDIDPEPSQNSR